MSFNYLSKQILILISPEIFADLIQKYSDIKGVIYLQSLDSRENWQECKRYLYLSSGFSEQQFTE